MTTLDSLLQDFRAFCDRNPALKRKPIAETIGCSPSGLSQILSGANRPSSEQTLAILALIRNTVPARITDFQANANGTLVRGQPEQRVAFDTPQNRAYLANPAKRVYHDAGDDERIHFVNPRGGWVSGRDADPNDSGADITDVRGAANQPSGDTNIGDTLAAVLRGLNNLQKQIGALLGRQPTAKPNPAGSTPRNGQRF